MAEKFKAPRFQQVDSSGNPIIGSLGFYITGTSTPIAVWSDRACTAALTNPVNADSNGRMPAVWIASAQLTAGVKVIYYSGPNGTGSTIFSDDPYEETQLYQRTAAEISAGVTPVNYSYEPCDVRRYGTNTSPGVTDMSTAVVNAGAASATGAGNVIIAENFLVDSSFTLPAGATLEFRQGGKLTVATTRTLTINSKILAPLAEIFGGAGTVVFGGLLAARTATAYPEWFGALHDNAAIDGPAIQKAIDMVAPCYGEVALSNGYYRVATTLTVGNRVRIRGVTWISTVIVFAPTVNDDSLFENSATDSCVFEDFSCAAGGSATGVRAFTISSTASAFLWERMAFSGFMDWAISIDSGQYHKIIKCRFGSIHNATDTGVAVRSTTYNNRFTCDDCRFFNNDRDIIIDTGTAVSITNVGCEATGALAATARLSINLVSVSGFEISTGYIEACRVGVGNGSIELEDCDSGVVENMYMSGDIGGTTYVTTHVKLVGNSRGIKIRNCKFLECTLFFVWNAGNYVVRCHDNHYTDGAVQLTTYNTVIPKMDGENLIDLDLPFEVTFNPASIADGAGETSVALAIAGASFGDTYEVAAPYDLQGLTATGYTSATNAARIRLDNQTGGAVDLASGTWKVFRHAKTL